MFIPLGKPLHENLSTRYLLVDALIEDLSEQAFAGLVAANLPDENYHVLMDEGKIVAILDSQFVGANLATVVSRCRAEPGGVSIHTYPQGLALTFAARMAAEPLYVNLSADFADLEKLIIKLMRELDRRWFIEVTTGKEKALIFIDAGNCTLITAAGEMLRVGGQTTGELRNSELKELIEKCHAQGGSFDVLFQRADEELFSVEAAQTATEHSESDSQNQSPDTTIPSQLSEEMKTAEAAAMQESAAGLDVESHAGFVWQNEDSDIALTEEPQAESLYPSKDDWQEPSRASAAFSDASDDEPEAVVNEISAPTAANDGEADSKVKKEAEALPTYDLMAALGNNREALEGLKMAEVKRLLGKMLKTITDAARTVEQRDNFNLHLRAGQLKIADRFAFLDPFGSEFEYFDGEIAFIGHCESAIFIEGITEAVKMAITEAAQASAKPVQLRAFINEELQRLLETNREEFALYHLDDSINEIIGRQLSKPSAAE